jgi:Cu-Zn family superoxide dismutase
MRKTLALTVVLPVLIACSEGSDASPNSQEMQPVQPEQSAETSRPAPLDEMTAEIIGTDGDTIGEAVATLGPNGMVIRLEAMGIPEGFHGVHLHQVGDCSDPEAGFKASGSHIDINSNKHGLLNPDGYHIGADFPNAYAGPDSLRTELFAGGLTGDQANDTDGFALIIHENEDDHITQPIGGAGGRIACAAFN